MTADDRDANRHLLMIRDLSLAYESREGPVLALDSVNLDVADGDFVCVVGPSGCGKTTLLQVIAGFISPTRGQALLKSQPIIGPGPDRGVVFQQPALFPWMNVYENAEFGLKMKGVPQAQRRGPVEANLKLVGLWDFRNKYTYQLSGGMQQRLAIARVLVNDPTMLLMDEPFGALDALTRERLQEELQSLWRETRKTIIFITHSVEEAIFLGTRVVAMCPRPGRIVEEIPLPFAASSKGMGAREIKASPEFVAFRERVLKLILTSTVT